MTGGDVIHFRPPILADGAAVFDLVKACPPLDLNSRYAYFLQCSHFAATCAVAETADRMVGFLSAYRQPAAADRLFVWQVAVDAAARGHGVAGGLLDAVLQRPENADLRFVEVTVGPSNTASRAVFRRFAERRDADWREDVFLEADAFGADAHESEIRIQIGPF